MKVSKETAAMMARLGLDPEEVIYNPDGSVTDMTARVYHLDGAIEELHGGLHLIEGLHAQLKRQKAQRSKGLPSNK